MQRRTSLMLFSSQTPQKPSLLVRIRNEMHHYWNGTKLLALETRISSRLLIKLLKGEKLIRREYRQLIRTTSDLFRLIPFIVIAIVPFLELALPLIIKFFPNLLPSTFESQHQAEEKIKRQLKIKLETAKFLQEIAESISKEKSGQIKNMKDLFEKTRSSGENLTADQVFEVCNHLKDEITLENLSRPQLISLCRYMNLNTFGSSNFLRFQLQNSINKLKEDDLWILKEGISSMTPEELKAACHARGIRTIDVSINYMHRELQQWIDLQVRHAVPAPILILSRAFALSEGLKIEDAIRVTVSSLPDQAIHEASELSEGAQPTEKIAIIKEQERLIVEDLESRGIKAESTASKDSPLSSEQIESIQEAFVTFATDEPMKLEREKLEKIKKERSTLKESLKDADSSAKTISSEVDRLILEITSDLHKFESEIVKRCKIIEPSSDGGITRTQLQQIFKHVQNSPKDSQKIFQAIEAFDRDQDGKIFIEDIKKIAERAEGNTDN